MMNNKSQPKKSIFNNRSVIALGLWARKRIARGGWFYQLLWRFKQRSLNRIANTNEPIWEASHTTFLSAITRQSKLRGESFFFIQVGANDGVMDDPIRPFVETLPWKGVFIEPQKEIFQFLKANYSSSEFDNRFIFENVALAAKSGTMKLFKGKTVESIGLDTGLASFVMTDHLKSYEARGMLEIEEVETLTPEMLLFRHGIHAIDLLQIDTEGFDYEIIKLFRFHELIKPAIVHFEHRHLDNGTYDKCISHLQSAGYCILPMRWDTAAVLPTVLSSN